jgi:MFS family permease
VVVAIVTLVKVREPERWQRAPVAARRNPLVVILTPPYLRRTMVNCTLLTVAIIGLWAGAVYEPTAIILLARAHGLTQPDAVRMVSYGTGLLSIGTILGCLALPPIAERVGRRATLALYFLGMAASVGLSFGWAFYLPAATALPVFMVMLFFLGFAGGNFALFALWLPEQYGTDVRATAFAFCTSIGRFIGAGVRSMGTLGTPIALTAIAFGIGLLVIPFAMETRGQRLPA